MKQSRYDIVYVCALEISKTDIKIIKENRKKCAKQVLKFRMMDTKAKKS